jgi:hypothetical protein
MKSSYRPFQKTLDYFNNQGEFTFTDDEIVKFTEIFSFIKHKVDNNDEINETASPETMEQRKATCRSCVHYNAKHDGCKLCGCRIEQKVTKPSEKCPRQLWGFDLLYFKELFSGFASELNQTLQDPFVQTIEKLASEAKIEFEKGEASE